MGLQINDITVENTLSASTMTATTLYIGANSIGGSVSNFNSLSATTLSGGTIYSGGTDLYNIFLTTNDGNDITRVQPGSNITTGGTANNPTVNLVTSPSINGLSFSGIANGLALSATTLSGGTLFSGNTDVSTLFATPANITSINSQLTTKANLSGATFTSAVVAPNLSATTISGGTLYSGSTDLYSIFATVPDQNDVTRVQPGSNITTGGTANNPTVNLVASPSVNSITASGSSNFSAGLSASTLSGGTIFSGSSNVDTLFATPANITSINSQLTTKANLSGATFTGTVNAGVLSATTLSATTLFSGSTNVGTLFATPANITSINAQLLTKANDSGDTFTGAVIINSTLNVTGATSLATLSATTMISGSTNLYNIFALSGGTLKHKSGTISGSTFAGNPKKATVTFATAFANTNYAITILSDTNRTWTWESKAAGSFVINANSNTGFATGNVDWTATEYGEK